MPQARPALSFAPSPALGHPTHSLIALPLFALPSTEIFLRHCKIQNKKWRYSYRENSVSKNGHSIKILTFPRIITFFEKTAAAAHAQKKTQATYNFDSAQSFRFERVRQKMIKSQIFEGSF